MKTRHCNHDGKRERKEVCGGLRQGWLGWVTTALCRGESKVCWMVMKITCNRCNPRGSQNEQTVSFDSKV